MARSEEDITALEGRIKARTEELATPALYQDFPRWNELHQEHERWKEELDVLTNRWSTLSTELAELKDQLAKSRLRNIPNRRSGSIIFFLFQFFGQMGLFSTGLRVMMDVAISLAIAQVLHQRRHGVP